MSSKPIVWAVGVTTVFERSDIVLKTLHSLELAGFEKPRLFIDGIERASIAMLNSYKIATRYPKVGAFGNWILGLWELYLRNPTATRFAMFQDDILLCKNARQFVEKTAHSPKGYWSLYCSAHFEKRNECNVQIGYTNRWLRSNLYGEGKFVGQGALALVFTKDAVEKILTSQLVFAKPQQSGNPTVNTMNIDGVVYRAMKNAGFMEYVHVPSLVQHVGRDSTLKEKKPFVESTTFPGVDFDCLGLLK